MPRSAAFLDRDGTITVEIGRGLETPREVTLVPGAAAAIRKLNQAEIPVVVVTNQAGVARGTISEATLAEIHTRMRELLAQEGARVDAIYHCPHHPSEGKGENLKDCDCRKPKDGLLRRAARELGLDLASSFAAGDRATDIAAAHAAGMHAVAVSNGWAHAPWEPAAGADEIFASLPEAVDAFLARRKEVRS